MDRAGRVGSILQCVCVGWFACYALPTSALMFAEVRGGECAGADLQGLMEGGTVHACCTQARSARTPPKLVHGGCLGKPPQLHQGEVGQLGEGHVAGPLRQVVCQQLKHLRGRGGCLRFKFELKLVQLNSLGELTRVQLYCDLISQ